MKILHAPNVHGGGGLTLLQGLLKYLPARSYLIVDERFPLTDEAYASFQVKRVKPTLWGRFRAELFLSRLVRQDDHVLCFGNLPPLFKLKCEVRLFLQNRYLVEAVPLRGFPPKARVRIIIERLWLKWFGGNVDKLIVQTPSMQALVKKSLSMNSEIFPFVVNTKLFSGDVGKVPVDGKMYEFIYVASGEPHKNHRNLVKAWILLAQRDIHPFLVLTLNDEQFAELISWIDKQKNEYDLNILNFGLVSGDEIKNLYLKSRTLIFPSTLESFGIPLIEARSAGLSIVASELDYVRDIVDPEESFDPSSPVSIARAVQRLLGEKETKLAPLDAESFLQNLFED